MMNIFTHKESKKMFTYALVGGLGTIIHFGTLVLLVELFFLDPVLASTIGFILTLIVSYYLNKTYTFKATNKNGAFQFIKYTVVSCTGLLLNGIIMFVMLHTLSFHYAIGQGMVIIVLPITNYLLNNFWTFR